MQPKYFGLKTLKKKGETISEYVDRLRAIQEAERKVTVERIAALKLPNNEHLAVLNLFQAIQEAVNAYGRKDGGLFPPVVNETALLMHLDEFRRVVDQAIKSA